jgi:hypothetical protein
VSYSDAYSPAYDVTGEPVPPPPAGPLTVLREQVAAALAVIPAVEAGDWMVLSAPVDAVEPPVYLTQWGPDPWRTINTVCVDDAQLEVIAVAARLEPEANYPILEAMVDDAHTALTAARLRPYQTLAPGPFEVAQVTYLAARLQLRQPVTIGGIP